MNIFRKCREGRIWMLWQSKPPKDAIVIEDELGGLPVYDKPPAETTHLSIERILDDSMRVGGDMGKILQRAKRKTARQLLQRHQGTGNAFVMVEEDGACSLKLLPPETDDHRLAVLLRDEIHQAIADDDQYQNYFQFI